MSLFPTILGLCALAVKDTLPNLTANGSNAMIEVASAYAPGFITGLVAAAIICATMSSADSNLLCMSTMVMNDLVFGNGFCKDMEDKKVLFVTRTMNVIFAFCAMCISMLGIPIVTLNTFAFGIRCAGPFAAYGLGMMVEKCTKNAGVLSIITGTIGFVFWQALSGGSFLFGILPVVFGCAIGTATFFIVNAIELKAGKPVAPSAFIEE